MILLKIRILICVSLLFTFCNRKGKSSDLGFSDEKIKIHYSFYSSIDGETLSYNAELSYEFDSLLMYNLLVNDSMLFFKNDYECGFLNLTSKYFDKNIELNELGLPTGNFAEDLFPEFVYNKKYFSDLVSESKNETIIIKKIGQVTLIEKIAKQDIFDETEPIKFLGSSQFICVNNSTNKVFFDYTIANFNMNGLNFIQKEFKSYSYIKNIKDSSINEYNSILNSLKESKVNVTGVNKYIEGKIMPEFVFYNLNNEKFESSSIKKDFVFIEFWYLSCAPCIQNMKSLNNLCAEFEDKNVQFLILNDMDDNIDRINNLKKRLNLNCNLYYQGNEISKKLNITEHPYTLIYDNRTREILYIKTGTNSKYANEVKLFLDSLVSD